MFREGRRHAGPLVIIGALWLVISACSSPTAPSVPNVQGFWHGSFVVDACTGPGAAPSPSCLSGAGPLNLRVMLSGRTLRAFIYICTVEINDLTGTVAPDGTITLSGQVGPTQYSGGMTLSSFQATTNAAAAMTGTFACTLYPDTPDTVSIKGHLTDVPRFSPDPNAPF